MTADPTIQAYAGTPIDLYFDNMQKQQIHTKSEFIGCLPGLSVLIREPFNEKYSIKSPELQAGKVVKIKMITNQAKLTYTLFAATIERHIALKESLLVLDFPKKLHVETLRKKLRIPVEFMVELLTPVHQMPVMAMVTDLSAYGCKLTIPKVDSLTDTFFNDLLHESVTIKGAIGEMTDKPFAIRCTVKNHSLNKDRYALGLLFDDNQNQSLINSVYTELALGYFGV